MAIATLDGIDIFGAQVSIDHNPQTSAAQISAFFGVSGTISQFGGSRGRTFMVRGVAVADSLYTLGQYEMVFGTYNDGVARVLVDPLGRVWPNVIFKGEFVFQGPIGYIETGVVRPYRAVFYGLS